MPVEENVPRIFDHFRQWFNGETTQQGQQELRLGVRVLEARLEQLLAVDEPNYDIVADVIMQRARVVERLVHEQQLEQVARQAREILTQDAARQQLQLPQQLAQSQEQEQHLHLQSEETYQQNGRELDRQAVLAAIRAASNAEVHGGATAEALSHPQEQGAQVQIWQEQEHIENASHPPGEQSPLPQRHQHANQHAQQQEVLQQQPVQAVDPDHRLEQVTLQQDELHQAQMGAVLAEVQQGGARGAVPPDVPHREAELWRSDVAAAIQLHQEAQAAWQAEWALREREVLQRSMLQLAMQRELQGQYLVAVQQRQQAAAAALMEQSLQQQRQQHHLWLHGQPPGPFQSAGGGFGQSQSSAEAPGEASTDVRGQRVAHMFGAAAGTAAQGGSAGGTAASQDCSSNSEVSFVAPLPKTVPSDADMCVICLSEPKKTGFMHVDPPGSVYTHLCACKACADRWYHTKGTCPVCGVRSQLLVDVYNS